MDIGTRFKSVHQRVAAYRLHCKMWNKPCRFTDDELDDVYRFINGMMTNDFEKFIKENEND